MVIKELPLIIILQEVDAKVDALSLKSAIIYAKRKTSYKDWNYNSIKEHN